MGYFGAWNELYNSEEEKVLCEIDVLGQRILRVTPDQGMHSIDSNIGHYQYHLSIQSFAEFDRIGILDDEEDQLSTATDQMEENQFDFNLPGKDAIYLQYMVCIGLFKNLKVIQSHLENATNFPHDGLYIEYELDLSSSHFEADQYSGRTHLCFTQPYGEVKKLTDFIKPTF
jgi:hypothetical protein